MRKIVTQKLFEGLLFELQNHLYKQKQEWRPLLIIPWESQNDTYKEKHEQGSLLIIVLFLSSCQILQGVPRKRYWYSFNSDLLVTLI